MAKRASVAAATRRWPPYSRLLVVGDSADWSIADDVRQLRKIAERLRVELAPGEWAPGVRRQSLFYASQFFLLRRRWEGRGNRLGVAYLHGRPGTPGVPEFDLCYEAVRRRRASLVRIQVSNRAMREIVLETGIEPEKVFLIPIGVDTDCFRLRDESSRRAARERLGVPASAFVAGSFQKDGVGWEEGLEPKLIKGPDVLLAAVERLRQRLPELMLLLTGPARGYVKQGLERLGVPYRHLRAADLEGVAEAFRACDVCLVSSRDEGGPKAVLQAMASGVPLVTTRVGQAEDLVRHGENGFIVAVEDAEGLAYWTERVAATPAAELGAIVGRGRATAEANSYQALAPRWRELMTGFVRIGGGVGE